MGALDARVRIDPSTAWTAAQSLTTISTTVDNAGEDISSAHNQVASDCTSETTNAAVSAELVVSGTDIYSPEESDEKYEAKKAIYDHLNETLYLIRQDESTAHDSLISSCDSLKSAAEWFRDKYLPSGEPGDLSKAAGWSNRLATGVRWGSIQAISRFQPRYPKGGPNGGRFMSAADRAKMGPLRTLWAKTKPENWVNKPFTRGTTAWKVQQAAAKAAPTLKRVGRASAVLSGGLAGWEQYKKDSDNPNMGEREKIARAGTQAVTQGAGGYAGGWAGPGSAWRARRRGSSWATPSIRVGRRSSTRVPALVPMLIVLVSFTPIPLPAWMYPEWHEARRRQRRRARIAEASSWRSAARLDPGTASTSAVSSVISRPADPAAVPPPDGSSPHSPDVSGDNV